MKRHLYHIMLAAPFILAGYFISFKFGPVSAGSFAGFVVLWGRESTQQAWRLVRDTGNDSLKDLTPWQWVSTFSPFTYTDHNRNDFFVVFIVCLVTGILGAIYHD